MCRSRSIPAAIACRGEHVAVVDVEDVRIEAHRGRSRRNGSARIQCVVAGRPSSTPAAASTNAPVQIDTSRAPGRAVASAAASAASSRPSVTGGPPHDARDDDVVGGRAGSTRRGPAAPSSAADVRTGPPSTVHVRTLVARRPSSSTGARRGTGAGRPSSKATTWRQGEDGDLHRSWPDFFTCWLSGHCRRRRVRERGAVTQTVPRRPTDAPAASTPPGGWPPSTFVALLGAAGFRATPGVLIEPLQAEFGWSIGTISAACRSTWCCSG